MEKCNLKYNVRATVLSPLSIGQGEEKDWVEGIDFIVQNGLLYHITLDRMVEAGIDINKLAALFVGSRPEDSFRLLGSRLEDISDFQMKMPCSSPNPVKTFFRNQFTGNPVLCGSSLKGAIRSALFNYFSTGNRDSLYGNKRADEAVFGSIKEKNGSDFMRFIRIGDIDFSTTGLVNTKIYNLQGRGNTWEGGWKHAVNKTDCSYSPTGFNTIYECLLPGEEGNGSIMLSPHLFESADMYKCASIDKMRMLMHSDKSGKKPNEKLCDIINDYTYNHLSKDFEFFQKYDQGQNSGLILDSINDIIDHIPDVNESTDECVIRLSAGSGFHAITGDWQYEDYTDTGYYDIGRNKGKKKYKSRKIASFEEKLMPMGYIKLKISE